MWIPIGARETMISSDTKSELDTKNKTQYTSYYTERKKCVNNYIILKIIITNNVIVERDKNKLKDCYKFSRYCFEPAYIYI